MKNGVIMLSAGMLSLVMACNEYKKKEVTGSWNPDWATISVYGGVPDTIDFDHVLNLKADNTYDWNGWMNEGEWEFNDKSTRIRIKSNDGTSEMWFDIMNGGSNTMELQSVTPGGVYYFKFSK